MTDQAKKKPGLRIVAVVAGGLAAVAVASSIAVRSAYEGVESRAFSTIDYIRQQSLAYESYNHATSMKSTMRVLENATNLAREIAGDGDTDPQKLADYARDLRVTGVIVLDADGRVASEYTTDGVGSAQLADELSRGALLDVAQNRSKVYGSAVTLPDGGRVDVDAACREDAPGIVVSLYHTSADFADRYTLTMVFTSADMPISEGVKYYFLEISAPDGYLLDKTPTSAFTIGHSGTGSSIEYRATFDDGHVSESATFGQTIAIDCGTVTDKAFGIVLSKVDADGKGIKGAKLEVREATGSKAIDSWESNGAGHVLSGVQPGVKYVFHEASAPSGYAQASDVEFTVDASGKVSIVSGGKATVSGKGVVNAYAGDASLTMIDYKKDEKVEYKTTERSEPRTTTKDRSIPQTGDTSASPLWLVVAAIVVTVAGFYFWRKSR